MCWGIYVVADRPLPEVESGNAQFPQFALRQLDGDSADLVRRATERRHVYYASSWQGCGCGFAYGTESEHKEKLAFTEGEPVLEQITRDDRTSALASVDSLSRYLAQVVVDGQVSVYVVDESDIGRQPSARKEVEPSFFGGTAFDFGDGSAMFEPTSLFEIKAPPGA
ncbi:MAG: hypothetical protein Rubg2KO_29930 [Rubricoccaceae bacterium]